MDNHFVIEAWLDGKISDQQLDQKIKQFVYVRQLHQRVYSDSI